MPGSRPATKKTFKAVGSRRSGPVRAPLLAFVGPLLASSFVCRDEIIELEDGRVVYAYTHRWTRRDLLVTLDGVAFTYTPTGRYRMTESRIVIRDVLTPWYRIAGGPTVEESVMIDRLLDGRPDPAPVDLAQEPSGEAQADEPVTAVVDVDAHLVARVRRAAPDDLTAAEAVRHALRLYALDREMAVEPLRPPLGAEDAGALLDDEAAVNRRRPAPPTAGWLLGEDPPSGEWRVDDRWAPQPRERPAWDAWRSAERDLPEDDILF